MKELRLSNDKHLVQDHSLREGFEHKHLTMTEDMHYENNLQCGSVHYCDKIPEIINLKRGKVYFGLSFGGFSPRSVGPTAFEGL
jgi:hypothetical protein